VGTDRGHEVGVATEVFIEVANQDYVTAHASGCSQFCFQILDALFSGIGLLDTGSPKDLPLLGEHRAWSSLRDGIFDDVVDTVDRHE
jgi:hypothetical protein